MKRLFTFLIVSCAALSAYSQGIEFFHGSWQEALTEARQRGTVIFVDAYTTWCGPCKRMASQIFPLQEVGDFFNPNFVNVKMDMESEAGLKFKRKYPVKSYPTFLFIAPDENVVMQAVGGRPAEQFIELGKEALKKYDGSAQYQVKYDAGDRSYEVVYNLVVALNKSNKSSLRVANDYLKTQADLRTPENLKLIVEALTQVDSKIYAYFETYRKDLVKISGEDVVNARLRDAASKTAARAVEYESEALLTEANAAIQKYLPAEAELFNITTSMDYAKAMGNAELYLKNAKVYIKKTSGDDADRLNGMATTIIEKFHEHKELLELGEKASKMSIQLKDNEKYNIVYATLIYLQGDKKRAISVIDDAVVRLQAASQKVAKLLELKSKLEAA